MRTTTKAVWTLVALNVLVYSCHNDDPRGGSNPDGGAGGEAGAEAGAPGTGGGSGGEPAAAGQGGDGNVAGAGASGAGGEPSAGGAGASGAGGDGGTGGEGSVVLPEGAIAGVPYTCDSPFDGVVFDSYFHREDFEDSALSTPGVTAPNTVSSLVGFGAGLVDSVDCDDGATDGTCLDCDALFGNGTITLTFDAAALGGLPTHVGLVWTDGGAGASVTISGYADQDDVMPVHSENVVGLGDASINGTVEEDRFFGIVHYAGVERVVIVNTTGGVEIDHLQYGR